MQQHAGNSRKNDQHGVSIAEVEQVFFNPPVLMLPDPTHSQAEPRYHALGKTTDGRRLHVTFTLLMFASQRDGHIDVVKSLFVRVITTEYSGARCYR
jgi:uncharacterized DUF497 family protein